MANGIWNMLCTTRNFAEDCRLLTAGQWVGVVTAAFFSGVGGMAVGALGDYGISQIPGVSANLEEQTPAVVTTGTAAAALGFYASVRRSASSNRHRAASTIDGFQLLPTVASS